MKINFRKYTISNDTLKKPSVIFLIFTICFSFFFVDLWKIWDAKKVKTTGSVLVEKQQFLMQLHAKMKSKLPESHSIA